MGQFRMCRCSGRGVGFLVVAASMVMLVGMLVDMPVVMLMAMLAVMLVPILVLV